MNPVVITVSPKRNRSLAWQDASPALRGPAPYGRVNAARSRPGAGRVAAPAQEEVQHARCRKSTDDGRPTQSQRTIHDVRFRPCWKFLLCAW